MSGPQAVPADTASGRWLIQRTRRPDAAVELFCFPHAGGSPGEYVRWGDELPSVQVSGIQLPGRGSRMSEEPFTSMAALVDAVVPVVHSDRPFVLFGHSLGGLVAFEVARALRDRGWPQPQRLILSAAPLPGRARRRLSGESLDDSELLDLVSRRWGGLPATIRQHPKYAASLAALYRSDFSVLDTYHYRPAPPLDCPISVLVGADEAAELEPWSWPDQTTADSEVRVLPGGHFYLREHPEQFLAALADILTSTLRADHYKSKGDNDDRSRRGRRAGTLAQAAPGGGC